MTTIPSLMGDEAHEGENVFHMLDSKKLEILGERSYIGPFIDYVRIPFVLVFGYTSFALRSVTFIASVAFFLICSYLLIKYVGKEESILPLILVTFSPIYLTQQRLAWAITFLPLYAALLLFLLVKNKWKHRFLLGGLVAGLGLANHLLFLPTLVAIIIVGIITAIRHPRILLSSWPIIIGFIAGFSMQFAILQLHPDDQGSQKAIAETVSDRWNAFPSLFPEIVSGSSYIASYTGSELSPVVMISITAILSILALIALIFPKHRNMAWIIAAALFIHLFVLLRIIDRFSLRYFTIFALGFWLLSGIGLEGIVGIIRKKNTAIANSITSIILAALIAWVIFGIAVPYLRTGGSTGIFSLGNRTDSASALVDTQPLFDCLKNLGPVTSENVHIYNRLEFWSRHYSEIQFADEDHKSTAKYLVDYRLPGSVKTNAAGAICPQLQHFRITERK